MLPWERYWIPFSTPETAEAMKATVRTAMMPTRTGVPTSPTHPLKRRPPAICSAPRPSEAAEPKRVPVDVRSR